MKRSVIVPIDATIIVELSDVAGDVLPGYTSVDVCVPNDEGVLVVVGKLYMSSESPDLNKMLRDLYDRHVVGARPPAPDVPGEPAEPEDPEDSIHD